MHRVGKRPEEADSQGLHTSILDQLARSADRLFKRYCFDDPAEAIYPLLDPDYALSIYQWFRRANPTEVTIGLPVAMGEVQRLLEAGGCQQPDTRPSPGGD